ncbi:BRCA1-associated ATM activator 1 isoform X1 [Anguilla anguilla]|uniref:BRCA1-associated ATM activator 1 isoform X1 n=1 Tax=Anguilla anguilla TaxID=7936 RepID=UPI0015A7C772|nr:BRCA1-associated ATM activator 1 isoform X1 [Anguilla anguilla]XP_035253389.1 BRCA1-associated ATM activator 1 isoform X1 [Anguilla anguilla]
MDSKCVELLPLVCSVLADPKQALSDDTCLEKFLDWFSALTAPDSPLLEIQPCLVTFISSVCKSKTAEPSILSFALKLTGLLAANEEGFYILKQQSILESAFEYQGWSDSCLWEDATVRSGWAHGLHSMVQHQEAMCFLFRNGLIKVVLQLQVDKSLFVASAANQLLAHILNFSELRSTCTSLGNGSRTDLREVYEDRLAAECPEWADGIVEIMKHVEDSLMSTVPFRTRQSLKLVALSLAHCQPRVREMLWQRTERAVEVLLGNGQSSLTQLFMEVLQAAARTPLFIQTNSSIVTLIESVLCTSKPTQSIPFAAGIVHLENCPQSLKKKGIGVILQPLELVTASAGLQQLHSDHHGIESPKIGLLPEGGCQHTSLEEQLSQKSSCVSLLCLSLSSITQLAGTGSLNLEIPMQSLTLSVLNVLKFCVGMSVSSSPIISVFRNLIGCSKVQKCALDTLGSLCQSPENTVFRSEVFSVLLQYLDSPDTNSTVLQKAYQVTLKWLCVSSEPPPQVLFSGLKKRLCDMRWEVRDSSLEFLAQLTSHFHKNLGYCETLLSSGVPGLSLALLTDPESYVRASAILALGHSVLITSQAGVPTSDHVLLGDLARQFVDILVQDTEVFARRAVIKVFTLWLTSPYPTEDLEEPLRTVLTQGSEDLDWEVKVHTLELAQILISQTLAESSHSTCPYAVSHAPHANVENLTESLRKLQHLRIFTVLFKGLFDCDRPVAQSACSILLSLKSALTGNSSVTESKVACDLHGQNWVEDALKKHLERLHVGAESQKSMGFVEVLSVLDLEDMQQTLGQSSDHLENSPHSLMEDILAATRISEDNALDCY